MELILPPVFTLQGARSLGFTPAQVKYRCRIGRWRQVLGDGWTAMAGPLSLEARIEAVRLTWPDAVLSTRTAAIVHGFPLADDDLIHVFAPTKRHPRAGVSMRVLRPEPEALMSLGAQLITTPTRTALDCLSFLDEPDGMRVLAWAVTRRFIDLETAQSHLRTRHGLAGSRRLREYLRFLTTNAASHAELRFHKMLRRAGIDGWLANHPIRDGTTIVASADVVFMPLWLIVEIDGARAHLNPSLDAQRDATLGRLGYDVVRIPAGLLYSQPRQVLELVRHEIRVRERLGRKDPA